MQSVILANSVHHGFIQTSVSKLTMIVLFGRKETLGRGRVARADMVGSRRSFAAGRRWLARSCTSSL